MMFFPVFWVLRSTPVTVAATHTHHVFEDKTVIQFSDAYNAHAKFEGHLFDQF